MIHGAYFTPSLPAKLFPFSFLHPHPTSTTTTYSKIHIHYSNILASFQEKNYNFPLPHPFHKVVFTYGTLCDPSHHIQLVQYHSIAAYNSQDHLIYHICKLTALADPNRHGWNPVHGRDPGPPPPSFSPSSQPPPSYQTIDPNNPAMAGRGYNTFHGFDTGPPPPGFGPVQPVGVPQYPAFFNAPAAVPGFGWPQPTFAPQPVIAAPGQVPVMNFAPYPGFPGTYPAPAPTTDHGIPGVHLRNHTGGVGLPPGYNYAFPREHCKIHVFKTAMPPWQSTISPHDESKHVKLFVPCNVTVKELMQQLGATNEDAKKNKLHEVTEAGNGRWVKGISIAGDDKDRVKKGIAEFGWDKSRTGYPGERPVVWLWVTKD